jgi:2-(1,2-epoxy-1,2-dihydrophenyl)acetyl-CoA isomerase
VDGPVQLTVAEGLARIRLMRPEQANTIDLATARALDRVTLACEHDASVRAVLVTGAGARFCGGGDLRSFASLGEDLPAHLREVTTHLHAAIIRLANLDAPVIAAVQGAAAGAGFSLAMACDLVIAAEDAVFAPAYAKVGLSTDGSLSYFLPRLVGVRRALDLLLLSRPVRAAEALDLGLVSRVVPVEDLAEEAAATATALASGPTRALAAIKRLVRDSSEVSLETQLEREGSTLSRMAATSDAREGIAAFTEKRSPDFQGR